ncbi:MAG: citrate lyase holo-[acyl-carrier protein] synthase [Desulfuromonadaceae bacterium]
MPYAKLRNDILNARNRRQALLEQHLPPAGASLLQLSLNLPGAAKASLPGAAALFRWAQAQLQTQWESLDPLLMETDCLGPWGLFRVDRPPAATKGGAVTIEESQSFARLLDLDVYDDDGQPWDRTRLGLPERLCLLCALPARECIRRKRHSPQQLKEQLEKLLAPFTA